MQEVIQTANLELHSNAYAALNAAQLFTDDEIRYLDEACQIIPKTIIEIGDVGEQNYLSVGRFMEDQKGQLPQYRNDPYGKRVVDILSSGKSREFFNGIMQGECFIRRCQSNLLEAGNFIGKHMGSTRCRAEPALRSRPPWTNPTCTTSKSDRSDRPTTQVRTRGRRRQKESKA